LKFSRQFSPGDAKIKSWHDGKGRNSRDLAVMR
jgi:hypothetical protein